MARPIVAFDYDGTLVDAYEVKRESYWRAVAETLGLDETARPVVDASYARTSGAHRLRQLADTAQALGVEVTPAQAEMFSRRYSAYNEAAKERIVEFPSARAVLEALCQRCDLALISGLPQELLAAEAADRALAAYFTLIDGGDKDRALRRLREQGRTVLLFVGDTPHDEAVARAHGVPFHRVRGDADLARVPAVLDEVGAGRD
ncbi:MAG TPA: HAD family hydrolase [bacterium]|nr:HAD family hydrolase [bacterium]